MLVSVIGLDGCGKSTLIQKIAENIPSSILTKEPGSPLVPLNPQIRQLVLEDPSLSPFERELLFYTDASAHKRVLQEISDNIILCDRGLYCHYAYLRGYLKTKKLNFEQYSLCRKLIEQCCAKPDLVIYLKGSLELMRIRTAGKKKDIIESNSPSFYSYVLETYEDLMMACPYKHLILEATDPVDTNVERVLSFLQEEGYGSSS